MQNPVRSAAVAAAFALCCLFALLPAEATTVASPVIRCPGGQISTYLLSAPADGAQPIGRFFNGTFAAVTGGYSGAYAAVTIGQSVGFIETACLELNPAQNPVGTALPVVAIQNSYGVGLHLRAAPDIGTEESPTYSAGLFRNGTQVTVLGVLQDWAYVQVGGLTGYMRLYGLPALQAYALAGSGQSGGFSLYYKQITKQDTHGYTVTGTLTGSAPQQYTATVGVLFNGVMLNGILIGYNLYFNDTPAGFLEADGWVGGNSQDGAPVSFSAEFSVPEGTQRVRLTPVWSRSGFRQDGEEAPGYEDNFMFGLDP